MELIYRSSGARFSGSSPAALVACFVCIVALFACCLASSLDVAVAFVACIFMHVFSFDRSSRACLFTKSFRIRLSWLHYTHSAERPMPLMDGLLRISLAAKQAPHGRLDRTQP